MDAGVVGVPPDNTARGCLAYREPGADTATLSIDVFRAATAVAVPVEKLIVGAES
jgi:hypothetical protein